jgi:cytochrome P450
VGGTRLSDLEIGLFCILLLIGGNETTRHTLAHALLLLIEHPGECDRLRQEPARSHTATDEILRHSSALMQFTRIATTDTELAGVRIAQGEQLRLWHTSANRDETVFDAPGRFDIGRKENPYLTFGGGPHICLGATLARLEIRVMLEELLPQVASMELSSAPTRLRSDLINGITHLPIRLVPS